ncbi:MAG: DUF814 domain-containing protein [Planctomycetes bacterium]|nr:DUF814 domain-containing protein [Planctomycetota bacterium]
MPDPAPADRPVERSLSAAELGLAVAELAAACGAVVLDAVPLDGTGGNDDLLLVLRAPDDEAAPKQFVHAALGGTRARLCTTARRFGRDRRGRGPGADVLLRELERLTLVAVEHVAGERRCTLRFGGGERPTRRLEIELFGARGLWALCDETGAILTLSRPVETAVRTLRRGDAYAPPPPAPAGHARPGPAPRFPPPVLAAIDAHFTALDLAAEQQGSLDALRLAAERALRRAAQQRDGIARQLADGERAQALRATADLMLAYAHSVRRGATSMTVPALDGDGEQTIELDPAKPIAVQANQLYDKARRLDDGRETTERRHAAAAALADELTTIAAELVGAPPPAEDRLDALRQRMVALGALPKPKPEAKAAGKPGRKPAEAKVPFRRFTSAEGYPLYVGRNNAQNDELTMRFANGNDLWLHVGGGRPGSHVVVRLPKNKSASLETLLDAATLAVHFSKARGEPRIDVIYTPRKHVRKPKGLPPGAVVPSQTKTITVLSDDARLRRVLDTGGDDDA